MRLHFNLIIIGAAVAWALVLIALQWVYVCWSGASPDLAFGMGVMMFMWPVPGVLRLVRQCQRQKGWPEWMDERKLLIGLSLIIGLMLVVTGGRFWWFWSIAAGVWPITLVYTFVNSRVGVTLLLRVFKGRLHKSEAPPNGN